MSRVFITDRIIDPDIERAVLGDEVSTEPDRDAEVLLVWHQVVDAAYQASFPALRAIVRYGVGFDRIDLRAARARGVDVCNTPDYCVDEVSDTAVAMILGLVRGVGRLDALSRGLSGSWQENTLPGVRRSSALTVGVVGAGRIGSSVLLRLAPFKMQRQFFDPYVATGYERVLGVKRCGSLEELLASSDVVSLHVPLDDETRGMVNGAFLARMKPGAFLVNTARGALVADLDDLHDGLAIGQLGGVALDVLPSEPPRPGPLVDAWRRRDPWLDGRLVINPHNAFHSEEAAIEMRRKAAANARRVLQGRAPLDVVNR